MVVSLLARASEHSTFFFSRFERDGAINVIETAVLLAPSNQISLDELPEEIRTSANHESYFTVFLGSSLYEVERELIRRTIAFP
jgi:hypothetical protein